MVSQILSLVALFILMLSIVDTAKEFSLFLIAIIDGKSMNMTTLRGWALALSVAYILTYIFA